MSSTVSHFAFRLDPALLMTAAGMEPDPWQARVLRRGISPDGWNRALLLCSRQAGKSSVAAALGLHHALFSEGSLVLLVAPSLRQSRELFSKAWSLYRAAGMLGDVVKKSALRATFGNESRVIALPGKEGTIRGFSGVDLLVIDEAARVEDDLLAALRPMLAVSGGRLVALTTPAGKRGWFYEAFTGPENWHRERVPAKECPRITSEFLEQERRELGRFFFEQEYECQFHESENALFTRAEIDGAFDRSVVPLFEQTETAVSSEPTIQPL